MSYKQFFPESPDGCRGYTLIELMIALTVGLIILAGVSLLFLSMMRSREELEKTNRQIENGRYAMEVLSEDLRHAGYYGLKSFSCEEIYGNSTCVSPGAISGTSATHPAMWYRVDFSTVALPNICEKNVTHWISSGSTFPDYTYYTTNYLLWAVQGYNNLSTFPQTGCLSGGTALPSMSAGAPNSDGTYSGTDILVIRRQSTDAGCTATNQPCIQSGSLPGDGNRNITLKVGLPATSFDLQRVSGTAYATTEVNRLTTHIYFIATCSYGTGTDGACQTSDDTIPTLKLLELYGDNSTGPAFRMINVAEGIEDINYEYGIDNDHDGSPDIFTDAPTTQQWFNVVAIRINLLARNVDATGGTAEQKTFNLGAGKTSIAPTARQYRRHMYTQTVRVNNPSMRRE